MDVLSEEREAVFSLRFGKGDAIISQPAQYDRIVMTQNYVTDDGKISLTVAAPLGTLTAVWMKSLLIFIPLSFCFSFLTLYFTGIGRKCGCPWREKLSAV